MQLKRREKILLLVCVGMIGLTGLYFLLVAGDSRSTEQLVKERDKLTAEIDGKKKLLEAAARDKKRMEDWQKRSLPSDRKDAASLYQNWLSKLASQTSLRGTTITASDVGRRQAQFARLSFTLKARAGLGDLVSFLYGFYSRGYLHQIRRIDIKPIQDSKDLDLNLTIEALSLPTAIAKSELPTEPGHGLKLAKLSEYSEPIVKRNLFAAYVRPRPPQIVRPSPPPSMPAPRRERTIDPADYTFVTAFTEVDGVAQVWIQDRISGKPAWKLTKGETFTVGEVRGKVEDIDPAGEAVIQFDGRRRRLRGGDNLHGGKEISDEGANRAVRNN